ncbi:MAG: ribosome biogenesis GTPase YlqF [Christensenellales bacterium]|jgi:ribosome biogenesis GTP-binding protein ylqF
MAFINWYPGHMTKSIRMIEENIRLIDVLIYVLDARAPRSCINPDFDRYIQKLPVIYVLNKSDLADSAETEKWRGVLSGPMSEVVSLNSTVSKSSASVMASIRRLCGGKIDKYAAKGVKTTIKAMVLGVPNTGKSTLINNLIGKGKAVTGNKAGVTRGKQWFNAGEYTEILDTPGTLYPKLSDQTIARHLAYLGSIKDEVLDASELSCQLLKELSEIKPDSIVSRYGFVPVGDGEKDLDAVCHARSFMLKGGLPDTERASKAVIEDFRKGRLGKITLDFAEDA